MSENRIEPDRTKYIGVGWMLSKPGNDDYCMFINEQPDGGFKWTFLDFEPEDPENYRKIYISVEAPVVSSADSSFDNSAATKAGMETHGDLAFIFADGALWQHMQSQLSPTDDVAVMRHLWEATKRDAEHFRKECDALKAEVEQIQAEYLEDMAGYERTFKERDAYREANIRALGVLSNEAGDADDMMVQAIEELKAPQAQYDTTEKK